jgi:hypothetical protein
MIHMPASGQTPRQKGWCSGSRVEGYGKGLQQLGLVLDESQDDDWASGKLACSSIAPEPQLAQIRAGGFLGSAHFLLASQTGI